MQGEREFYVNVAAYEGQNSILDYITSYAIICMEMQVKEEMGMNILPEDVELSIYMWNLASTRLTLRGSRKRMNENRRRLQILYVTVYLNQSKYIINRLW